MNKFRLLATLLVVALCATTIFTSCRNDDDDNGGTFEIRATNVIGNTGRIATVRAVIYDDRDGTLPVGEAAFQNNGFTLPLSNEIPTSFLFPITSDYLFDSMSIPVDFISDRSARVNGTDWLCAYDRDGNKIGELQLFRSDEDSDESFFVSWLYVDRNVTAIGTEREESEWENLELRFNLNLRKGWNTVYWHSSYNESTRTEIWQFTTQRPSGANLRWEFSSWD